MATLKRLGSDFLYARPSFLAGVARLLDLWGCFDGYNRSRTPQEADSRAMYLDWYVVGQDMSDACEQFELQTSRDDSRQGNLFQDSAQAR
jgi:hypothetical protein